MTCELFLGEPDTKIMGRWIRKAKSTITWIKVPEDLWTDYGTQSLSNGARDE